MHFSQFQNLNISLRVWFKTQLMAFFAVDSLPGLMQIPRVLSPCKLYDAVTPIACHQEWEKMTHYSFIALTYVFLFRITAGTGAKQSMHRTEGRERPWIAELELGQYSDCTYPPVYYISQHKSGPNHG